MRGPSFVHPHPKALHGEAQLRRQACAPSATWARGQSWSFGTRDSAARHRGREAHPFQMPEIVVIVPSVSLFVFPRTVLLPRDSSTLPLLNNPYTALSVTVQFETRTVPPLTLTTPVVLLAA